MGGFPYDFPFDFDDKLIIQCDWDASSVFGDASGESLQGRTLAEAPIIIERGRDQIRQLAPPMAGRAECELWNVSKDYSPDYAAGPLYGNLVPGRQVRIHVDKFSTRYPLFSGYLDDLPQHPELPNRSVSFPCYGSLSKLRGQAEGQPISTPLYQSITTDVAFGYILDAIGWSTSTGPWGRNLDTGKTTLNYWWLDNEDAFSAMLTLLNTEGPGAAIYEDGLGRIVFESRHYRMLTARCTASQATFNDGGATQPLHSPPFVYNPRLKDVINVCTITQKERAIAGSLTEVWALGTALTLALGETRQVIARGSDIFTQAATPSTGSADYTLSAGTLSSVSLNRTSGASCTVTLTAGSGGATVTGLRLRAKLVAVTNTNELSNTISSTASQANYGVRRYPLNTRAEIDLDVAQDFCNAVVGTYQAPRGVAEITIVGASTSNLQQVLSREISDRVTIVEAQSGINDEFFVERIAHELEYAGQLMNARLGCEKATAAQYFILDTSVLDGADVLGY